MRVTLVLGALAALGSAVPVADPIALFNRATTPGTVYTQCSTAGTIALAYDDGPYTYTQTLVDTLNAAGAKATFFFTGTVYGCIYDHAAAVKSAYESGHQLASHTWSHGHVGSQSAATLTTEMTKLEQAYVNIIGKKPAYMRPPYLETGGSVAGVMQTLGYRIVTSDVDSKDWSGVSAAESEAIFTAAGAAGNGHISLMHETLASTVTELTPWLLSWAKTNGLRVVTVAECLGDAAGAYQPGTFPSNGQNTCS